MPKNTNSINEKLFSMLKTHGYKPIPLDATGKRIPVPRDADVFQFKVRTDHRMNEDSENSETTVTVSIDDNNDLKVYYNNDASKNDDWHKLLISLKKFAVRNGLGFDPVDQDELTFDMAKRVSEEKRKVVEGYYAAGRKNSWSDNVPQVKISIVHNKSLEEGEARYRNIERIFIENADGERILAPTGNTAVARTFARLIAEGDKPYGERWNHITSLMEDYTALRAFNRIAHGHKLNESANRLREEAYKVGMQLRETLHKLSTHRGYISYFESWTPSLLEDNDDQDINRVKSMLDEDLANHQYTIAALPVLTRINNTISENISITEVGVLEKWADDILDEAIGVNESRRFTKENNLSKAQRRVGQVGATELAKSTGGILGKAEKKHPFQGRLVGASESIEHDEMIEEDFKNWAKKAVAGATLGAAALGAAAHDTGKPHTGYDQKVTSASNASQSVDARRQRAEDELQKAEQAYQMAKEHLEYSQEAYKSFQDKKRNRQNVNRSIDSIGGVLGSLGSGKLGNIGKTIKSGAHTASQIDYDYNRGTEQQIVQNLQNARKEFKQAEMRFYLAKNALRGIR